MDLFSKCKALYEKIRYFEYGIPVDGVIKPVPSAEYYVKNYHFLKPEEFEKYGGGICWDYVEYERKFLEVNDIDFNQYYLITNTPPNYDTHTFITVKDGDDLIYIESSFKRVEHIIDGVQKFKSLEDIVRLITTNMWYCNDNDKHFDEFKYDVCKFKGHPQYGCTCQEYMDWMDNNSDIVIQDVSINPKKINNDELAVEEFTVNKVDTKFTQFVCESVNDPEEYDETLHDHIDDEDDVYNESWTDFKNGVHPSSGLMFHVSLKNDMDGKTINPQLPSYITDGGELDDNYQEDTKTKRLCVSPSIEGCLIAILSYNKIREHVGDKFYVYTPEKPFSQYKHKTNKEIVKDKLVFDANITKEAWILEPCKLKLYGIIKLKKVNDLKKKPTVEKNIKMNTIKLDYEWIMTPKASGKFNKAIGDSPDKGDDTKEKPIKEYDNILVSNEEFFMESQKRRDSYLKKIKYDPKTQTVDTGILDTKTGKNIRIKIKFDPSDPNGSYYKHPAMKDFKTENGYDLNKFLDAAYINIRRGDLNQKKNAGMTVFYHEIGHFLFDLVRYFRDHLNPSDVERLMKWDAEVEKYNASLNGDMVNILNSHDIDPEEMMADLNATSKVSRHSYEHHYKGYHDQNKNVKGLKKQEKIVNSKLEQAKANKDSKRLLNLYNTKDVVDTQNQALRENATSTKARLKVNEELTKRLNESANVIVSNDEFFMEANKNLVKSLKILDYDPETKTIKCDIPGYDGKPIKRVIFLIDDYISQEKGDGSVGLVVAKKELLEKYRSKTSDPKKLKAIDADIDYLNTRNDNEWAISIPRKILKTRNLQNLITVNHELGHIYCNETTSDDKWKEMQRWQRTRDEYDDIDRTVKNGDHAISTEELYADTYAADKVSAHALQKTDEKTFKKFKQDMYGYIKKAKVKQQKILNRLKSLPDKLTEEEEFEIKKQARDLVVEIRKLHKPGLPDSQQDPKALAMFKEVLKLEKKLDRSKDLPFEKNRIETDLYHIGDALDRYASAIKNLNIEHLTHHAYANKKDRIKFESFSVLVSNDEFFDLTE